MSEAIEGVLITGATGGIGNAIAQLLSEAGTPLVLVAKSEDKLREIHDTIPGASYIYPYDLSNVNDIQAIFDYCNENSVILKGMVHCAGVNNDHAIKHNDNDMMQQCFSINYMSFVNLLKYFVKKKYSCDGASIVALSSYTTFNTVSGQAIYASSKAAVETTVRIAAKEFSGRKIRVNAIAPNYVRTQMVSDSLFCDIDAINDSLPFGIIEPEYIAYLADFLLSEKARYVTGAVIPVSAGGL